MHPPSLARLLESFSGRFELRGRLGAGGMGVVHRAFDRELGREVALKTLRRASPGLLYSLKQEFRAAAHLRHPNLVQLHELFVAESECFFTMDLVEGVPFTHFVRQGWAPPEGLNDSAADATDSEQPIPSQSGIVRVPSRWSQSGLMPAARDTDAVRRLYLATAQLVAGVSALHEAGRVHCDIKPSNILVTQAGRLVLLDFGLSLPLEPVRAPRSEFAGTLAYAAPEQLWGEAATPATDWYSVGNVLFESLTGQLPSAEPAGLCARDVDLPSPVEPAFLSTVVALLASRPAERPAQELIATNLGQARPPARADAGFVGRSSEQRTLELALAAAADGWLSVVDVYGESGIGKTELVRRFALEAEREGALVARAQCRLQESVSHQALDQIIDDLSAYLLALPRQERANFLPEGFGSLVRLFPVLGRVHAPASGAGDAAAVRERATRALQRTLWRIGAERPVVLWIDDAHWGDAESQRFLCELLAAPTLPLLLVLSHRDAEPPWVKRIAQVVADSQGQWLELHVGPLGAEASQRLARQLLEAAGADAEGLAAHVAGESEGLPLFLCQLCRMIAETAGRGTAAQRPHWTLREVVERRVTKLSELERHIVQLAALAAAPLPAAAVLAAAAAATGSALAGGQLLVSQLAAAQLLRLSGGRAEPRLTSFHQRVRETLLATLDAGARRVGHRQLLTAIEQLGCELEPETLLHHLLGAGERPRALALARSAAQAAGERLAFAHAAALYQSALSLSEPGAERDALQRSLADALAASGQTCAAGEHYLGLVERADALESLRLLQLSAENLLVGGLLERGVLVLRRALGAARLRMPASRLGVALQALAQLAAFWLRSRLRPRRRAPAAALERVRAELCLSAAKGLGTVDPIASVQYALLALNLADRAGAADVRASALCLSGAVLAAVPGRVGVWGHAWLDEAERIAGESDGALRGRACACRAQVELMRGSWSTALAHCERAFELLRSHLGQTTWERNTARSISIRALEELGELKRSWASAGEWLNEARARGDLYAETTARLYLAPAQLAADRPAEAERLATLTLQSWNQRPPPFQEFYRLRLLAYIRLYQALPDAALELAAAAERVLCNAQLQHFPLAILEIRLLTARIRVRLALQHTSDMQGHLLACERDLQRLEHLGRPDASGYAALVRASLEVLQGQPGRAREQLVAARRCFEQRQMALSAVYVTAAENALDGPAAPADRVLETDARLRSQGILQPRAWLEMHGLLSGSVERPLQQRPGQGQRGHWQGPSAGQSDLPRGGRKRERASARR
jgi:hypothetical protein